MSRIAHRRLLNRRSDRTLALLAAATAAAASLVHPSLATAVVTVDGAITAGEYGPAAVSQNTPTQFGNNFSELNQAFFNYVPGGNLELALTGNLEGNGNGLVIFIDSKAGGAIANSFGGGFGQFGSVGGARIDDWGTDTDGSAAVTPTPGGGSILAPNFNPDLALEINSSGGGASYFINVIDLTVPNEPSDNRDIFLGSGTTNSGLPVTQTYLRDGGFTDAGDVTHSFNNTNTLGVDAFPGPVGDPSTATTGFEFLFEGAFLSPTPGHAVRILPFITNGGGDFLANQFLPGVNGAGNLGGPGGDGGAQLFNSQGFGDQFYIPLFVPTLMSGTTWATATWTGGVAPHGSEQAARLVGSSATAITLPGAGVALGYLELDNPAGYTLSGPEPVVFDGGAGAAGLFVLSGAHSIAIDTYIFTDTRANIASGASVALNGLRLTAGKRLTKAGAGTLTIGGTQSNAAGSSIAVDAGTLNVNGNLGADVATPADRPDLFVSTPGGGPGATVNLSVSQNLDQLTANPAGTVRLAIGGNKVITANTVSASGTGKIDIGDGDMVVAASPVGTWNGSAYTDVAGLVDSGRGAASNAQWDGGGIVTSDTRAVNNNDLASIGVESAAKIKGLSGTATAVWNGQTVTATDTLVMFTWGGDANMDGKINIDDYGQIDFNVASSGSVFGWYNGDFNYDGKINIDDYGIIDFNVTAQTGSLASSAGVEGVAAVPEPSAVAGLVAAAAVGLIRRRRRQQ